jgi:hypothetical protein
MPVRRGPWKQARAVPVRTQTIQTGMIKKNAIPESLFRAESCRQITPVKEGYECYRLLTSAVGPYGYCNGV